MYIGAAAAAAAAGQSVGQSRGGAAGSRAAGLGICIFYSSPFLKQRFRDIQVAVDSA